MSARVPQQYVMDPTRSSSSANPKLMSLVGSPSGLFCDYPSQDGDYEQKYAIFRTEVIFDYLLSTNPTLASNLSNPAVFTPDQFSDLKGRYVICSKEEGMLDVRVHIVENGAPTSFPGLWWMPFKAEDCVQGPYKVSDIPKFCVAALYQCKPIVADLSVWSQFIQTGVVPHTALPSQSK